MKKSLTIFFILLLVLSAFSLTSKTFIPNANAIPIKKSWEVVIGADDILRYGSSYHTGYSQNYMGHASVLMNGGYRFQNITIPNGANILHAYLSLTFSTVAGFDVIIRAFDLDTLSGLGNKANYDSLPRTDESVIWGEGITTAHTTWYNSTDIALLVQVVIDRELWSSGNDLGFEHNQTGDVMATSRQYAYESNNWKPRLYVEYEVDPLTYVTFYNQSNSVFMVNGTVMGNGTQTGYVNSTVLELQGIINVSTQFIEWDITTGDIYVNPYNYTASPNATIWLMVDGVEGGDPPENGGGETLFLFGSVTAIPMNLLYHIALTAIGLTLLLKAQFLGKILSVLLFAFQAIWISGDVLLDTQINYISAYNETTGIYQYANTVTHINTPILSFLIVLSIGLALKGAIDVFRLREKRKG